MLDFHSVDDLEDLVQHVNNSSQNIDKHIQNLLISSDINFNDSIDFLQYSLLDPLRNVTNVSRQNLDRITQTKFVEEEKKGVKRSLDEMEENWVVIGQGSEQKPKLSEGEQELFQRERFTLAQVSQQRLEEQWRALGGRVFSNKININNPSSTRTTTSQRFRDFFQKGFN